MKMTACQNIPHCEICPLKITGKRRNFPVFSGYQMLLHSIFDEMVG